MPRWGVQGKQNQLKPRASPHTEGTWGRNHPFWRVSLACPQPVPAGLEQDRVRVRVMVRVRAHSPLPSALCKTASGTDNSMGTGLRQWGVRVHPSGDWLPVCPSHLHVKVSPAAPNPPRSHGWFGKQTESIWVHLSPDQGTIYWVWFLPNKGVIVRGPRSGAASRPTRGCTPSGPLSPGLAMGPQGWVASWATGLQGPSPVTPFFLPFTALSEPEASERGTQGSPCRHALSWVRGGPGSQERVRVPGRSGLQGGSIGETRSQAARPSPDTCGGFGTEAAPAMGRQGLAPRDASVPREGTLQAGHRPPWQGPGSQAGPGTQGAGGDRREGRPYRLKTTAGGRQTGVWEAP